MTTVWYNAPNSVLHTKRNGDKLILHVGDCILYEGRDLPVRIESFTGTDEPIGFTYLPWRGDRWATPTMTLKGNPRFIICYPNGYSKFGHHIDWETVAVEQPK
jgi:hypothetical protein